MIVILVFRIYPLRILADYFNQGHGIDYEEMFAPVIRLTSVQSFLAIAYVRSWDLFQMDVKNAFFNSDLNKEVLYAASP